MIVTYFAHAHKTIATLHTVLRGKRWLEDSSNWLVKDIGKSIKGSKNRLVGIDAVKLAGFGTWDPPKRWLQTSEDVISVAVPGVSHLKPLFNRIVFQLTMLQSISPYSVFIFPFERMMYQPKPEHLVRGLWMSKVK